LNARRASPDVSAEHRRRLEAARPLSRVAVSVAAITLGAGLAVLLLDGWEVGPLAIVLTGLLVLVALAVPLRRARLCPGCGKALGTEPGIFCPVCGARVSPLDLDRLRDRPEELGR
jgi:hypothetical protein